MFQIHSNEPLVISQASILPAVPPHSVLFQQQQAMVKAHIMEKETVL